MDAIHIMPGQNGRSGRTDTAPPTAATDLGAAFSRALAALDRGAPKETAGEVEAPPEEDGVAIEEATAESDATADGETRSEDEAPVDGTLNGDLEHAAPVTAGPIEEEFLPLVMGEAATTAALADGSADSPAPTARSGLSPLQALVPAGTAPEISRASLGQQDATTTLTGAPASEAHSVPASSSAQTAAPVQPNVILPAMPREGASILPRVAATPISVMTDAEPASDADVIEPDGEIADVRVAPKAAGTDRYIPQNQPPITLPATTKVPIEAKADDGNASAG